MINGSVGAGVGRLLLWRGLLGRLAPHVGGVLRGDREHPAQDLFRVLPGQVALVRVAFAHRANGTPTSVKDGADDTADPSEALREVGGGDIRSEASLAEYLIPDEDVDVTRPHAWHVKRRYALAFIWDGEPLN